MELGISSLLTSAVVLVMVRLMGMMLLLLLLPPSCQVGKTINKLNREKKNSWSLSLHVVVLTWCLTKLTKLDKREPGPGLGPSFFFFSFLAGLTRRMS